MGEWIKKISLRELRLLLAGGGAVLLAAIASVAMIPAIKDWRTASQSVALLEQAAVPGDNLAQRIEQQRADIDALRVRLQGDMANLPVQQMEAYIIGRLQEISWRNEIELVSVQPSPGEKIEIFQELQFKVQLSGRYADLYRWLWEARKELGFVVVKDYEMSRQGDDDRDPRLLARLSLSSYRVEQ